MEIYSTKIKCSFLLDLCRWLCDHVIVESECSCYLQLWILGFGLVLRFIYVTICNYIFSSNITISYSAMHCSIHVAFSVSWLTSPLVMVTFPFLWVPELFLCLSHSSTTECHITATFPRRLTLCWTSLLHSRMQSLLQTVACHSCITRVMQKKQFIGSHTVANVIFAAIT
jgi:hypothetical protein